MLPASARRRQVRQSEDVPHVGRAVRRGRGAGRRGSAPRFTVVHQWIPRLSASLPALPAQRQARITIERVVQTTHDARETRLVGHVVDLSPLRREGVEQDRLPRARLAGVQARSCHRNTVGWDQTFQARTGHQVPFYASRARSQRCFAIATSPNSAAATTYPTRVDPVATPLNPAKSSPGICAPLSTR